MIKPQIKVCHMTSTHFPKDQRIYEKECISLAKAGYDVYLVEQGESEDAEEVHIIGTGEENSGRYYRLLVRPMKVYKIALTINADVYHFHDMELLPYGLRLKRKGKKVIFDCHEDFARRFADSDALPGPHAVKVLLQKLYIAYEKFVMKRMDAVIVVTPGDEMERIKKSNPNTVVITNYPLSRKGDWGKETSYNKQSDYISFAGLIDDTYKLEYITKTIQDIPGLKFKLCGPLRKKDSLKKIENVDKNHKIQYLGKLPYHDVPEVIYNSLAGIVVLDYGNNTGWKKGTLGCNKFFETMLCGVPVICTDFLLWQEIIDKYECGIYIDPSKPEQLRDAILYLINHRDKAEEMGQNGRMAASLMYNWETQEAVLLKLYEQLCNG